MYSRFKIFGHPVHPMLVAYPIAFYTGAFVSYAVALIGDSQLAFRIGVVANVAGVVMAAVAAIPGFIDWAFGIPKATPARSTGLTHMMLNVVALVLFAANALIQLGKWDDSAPDSTLALILAAVGVGFTLAAGFFGWTLVQDHHVGVNLREDQQRLEPAGGEQGGSR